MDNKNYQLQESLCYLINRASRTIRKYFNQISMRKGYNVTGEQFDVLVSLWDKDGQHQQRLAETLCKDKTTMTRLIKSIEALNLVKRVTNKKDERQKLVYLTKSGKKTIKELTRLAQKISTKSQKGIDPSDMAICKDVLRQIHETLFKKLT
ncbi:MAG: MarR family winged helix-turn-helix transcriptional regulator [Candidatus Kariarchaeaceae archaeon]